MTQQRLRVQARNQIDEAIAASRQPKAPRSGIGLVLHTSGRHRALYDKNGLTSAGKYYYEKTSIEPPGIFDYQQDPVRRGRSQYIKLLDGTQTKISTWDNVNNEWKVTALGKHSIRKLSISTSYSGH